MIFLLIIMIILSAVGLFSLYFTQSIFHTIEIISYFMIIVVMIQQVFLISTLNLGMIQISETISGFWTQNVNLLILIPCITIWLFCSFFSKSFSILKKIWLTAVWLFCMFGIEVLCHRLGLITFIRWNIGYSFIEWLIVLGGSLCFALLFRKLLRKMAYI